MAEDFDRFSDVFLDMRRKQNTAGLLRKHANIVILLRGLDMGDGGGEVNVDALVFEDNLHGHDRNVHDEFLVPQKILAVVAWVFHIYS